MKAQLTQSDLNRFNKGWISRFTKPIAILFGGLSVTLISTHMYFWLVAGGSHYGVKISHIEVALIASLLLIVSILLVVLIHLCSRKRVIKQRFFRQILALCIVGLGVAAISLVIFK